MVIKHLEHAEGNPTAVPNDRKKQTSLSILTFYVYIFFGKVSVEIFFIS